MLNYTEIKNLLKSLHTQLKIDLQNHPHFLVNEHDLQAYLYSKLTKEKQINRYVKDGDNDENYLIHCEYPRGYYKEKKFVNVGRWDIAILKDNQNNRYFWTEKPVEIGIELKLNIDEKATHAIEDINSEEFAVDSTDGKSKYADWAVLLHINIGKKEHDQTYNRVKKHIISLQEKNPGTFYFYLEAYRIKSEPKVFLLP